MSNYIPKSQVSSKPRLVALSQWENEGGALKDPVGADLLGLQEPPFSTTELVHLRIRVIALENLLLALLVEGTEAQTALAKEFAAHILPREGHTPHPLTIHAAQQMLQLVQRAEQFKRSG